MNAKLKNHALLVAGIALLAVSLYTLGGMLFGDLPHLSGATLGCVMSLVGGVLLSIKALLRMGRLEVVVVEESSGR